MRQRHRQIAGGLLALLLPLMLLLSPAAAYPRPGLTERVSVAADGTEADGASGRASITPDGRFVAFASSATNLVDGDTNGRSDVFVRDRVTGAVERVSLSSDGAEGNGHSTSPAMSADGRYVAFVSAASNLVSDDTNNGQDVFVRDLATGTTERVSVASGGSQAEHRLSAVNPHSSSPAMSADGRFVAFTSNATNFVPGDNAVGFAIFVHDRDTGATELMSAGPDGKKCDKPPDLVVGSANISLVSGGDANAASISADGRYVAFNSSCTDLVEDDTNEAHDVFVHDRDTGVVERVSVASDGTESNVRGGSVWASISADGRYVAFMSDASNLVPGDTNANTDIFVHDRETGVTERVSVASDGPEIDGMSYEGVISADGRHVVFASEPTATVTGLATEAQQVFVHDRVTRVTERVSVASDGTASNATNRFSPANRAYPAISADGGLVAFQSTATNLVPDDTNGVFDVFVRDRGGALGFVGDPVVLEGSSAVRVLGLATFSGEVLTEAVDPDDDATGSDAAREVGGELTGAALVYRPEREELLVRLQLASLPPVAGGLPGVVYGLDLTVGADRFQVRALRASAGTASPAAPYAALYRCDLVCTEHSPLAGSIGSTGEEVLVAVPFAALGATEGTALSGLRAFTAPSDAAAGPVVPIDEVSLADVAIPEARVELGIAPIGGGGAGITTEAALAGGEFSGTVSTTGLPLGDYRVWARSCLGGSCGPAVINEVWEFGSP